MASQVAHIIYADRYFKKYHAKFNRDEFMLGCIFPDIRRIDVRLKRADTHLCFEPVDLNFQGMSSFNAGWKFHVYCDMRREEILAKYGFYDFPGAADFWHIPSKLFEDEVLYSQFNNWEKLVNLCNNPPRLNRLVSHETWELWYAINARYFEKKPNSQTMRALISKFPKLASIAKDVSRVVDKLRKDKRVAEILEKVEEKVV
ncbi:MAG: hypothetical protein NTZ97_03270 [Candidatus Moranbacteria bacterium]|nr:hypothetical protein [Candidatus Moranbacteria bacterium]